MYTSSLLILSLARERKKNKELIGVIHLYKEKIKIKKIQYDSVIKKTK